MRTNPHGTRAGPVGAEHPPHPRLGQRATGRRAAEHHETLRGHAAGRPLVTQVGSELDEKRPLHRDDAFPAALARHPHPAQPHVHVGQPQGADLRGAQSTQRHQQHDRAVPVGSQVGEEVADLLRAHRLRQPPGLPDQPATGTSPAGANVAQQTAAFRA